VRWKSAYAPESSQSQAPCTASSPLHTIIRAVNSNSNRKILRDIVKRFYGFVYLVGSCRFRRRRWRWWCGRRRYSGGAPPSPESPHDSGDILYSGLNDVIPAVARYTGKCAHVRLVLIAFTTLLR